MYSTSVCAMSVGLFVRWGTDFKTVSPTADKFTGGTLCGFKKFNHLLRSDRLMSFGRKKPLKVSSHLCCTHHVTVLKGPSPCLCSWGEYCRMQDTIVLTCLYSRKRELASFSNWVQREAFQLAEALTTALPPAMTRVRATRGKERKPERMNEWGKQMYNWHMQTYIVHVCGVNKKVCKGLSINIKCFQSANFTKSPPPNPLLYGTKNFDDTCTKYV